MKPQVQAFLGVAATLTSAIAGFLLVSRCDGEAPRPSEVSHGNTGTAAAELEPLLEGREAANVRIEQALSHLRKEAIVSDRGGATDDDEWTTLERTGESFVVWCVRSPGSTDPNDFFRSEIFNPEDRYVTPDKREELVRLLDPVLKKSKDVETRVSDMGSMELDELIAKGALPFYSKKEHDAPQSAARSDLRKRLNEAPYMYRVTTEGCFPAALSQMPSTHQGVQILESLGLNVVLVASQFFVREGLLGPNQQVALLEFAQSQCRAIR